MANSYFVGCSPRHRSGFQVELLELLRCRAEVTEVADGRACRREREVLKRFGEHLVQILFGGDAGADVRMEMFAGRLRYELRDLGDQGREDLGNVAGDERGRGSRFHCERRHRVNHPRFQLDQFRSRFDDNAREAKILVWYVVVLDSFQLQAGHIGAGEDFADGGIHFVKILGDDAAPR